MRFQPTMATQLKRLLWLESPPSRDFVDSVSAIDVDDFKQFLTDRESSLAPFLYLCLERSGHLQHLKGEHLGFLRERRAYTASRNYLLERTVARVSQRFQEHGIEFLLLKGVSHLVENYARLASVISPWDIDMLVSRDTMERAEDALASLDFEFHRRQRIGDAEKVVYRGQDSVSIVDMHSAIFWESGPIFYRDLVPGDLWKRARKIELTFSGQEVHLLSREDEILLLFLHDVIVNPILTASIARLYFFAFLLYQNRSTIRWVVVLSHLKRADMKRLFGAYVSLVKREFYFRPPEELKFLIAETGSRVHYVELMRRAPHRLRSMNMLSSQAVCSDSSFVGSLTRLYRTRFSVLLRKQMERARDENDRNSLSGVVPFIKVHLLLTISILYLVGGKFFMDLKYRCLKRKHHL